jgi:nitrous oxidase accessory protein
MKFRLAVLLALAIALGSMGSAVAMEQGPAVLVVSPQGPYTTIQAALAAAQHGDTLQVHPGMYAGPLTVDKSVYLSGVDWPVIDGGGEGTVVHLNAPGIQFEGFEVRNSGVEPDRDHAGITLAAADIRVENNRLRDVLFGIFVAEADGAVLRGNDITSKEQYEVGRRGDGIRLWYSKNVLVDDNHVHGARDLVMWYADDVIVRNNRIENGRYGVHLMYCNRAQVLSNQLHGNSVGIYTMYSDDVLLSKNDIRQTRGPSGYALGFKDADRVEISHNLLVDNRGGILADGTPYRPGGYARFTENIFAFNDIAIILFPSVRGATFTDNTFWENVEQVSIGVGGKPRDNTWQANYWSDYTGFDLDGDNRGELPYRSERFFESLTDREPLLRTLIYSPAAQAIEFAATSFPIFKPQPKFSDEAPRLSPAELPESALPADVSSQRVGMALVGIGLLLTSAMGLVLLRRQSHAYY